MWLSYWKSISEPKFKKKILVILKNHKKKLWLLTCRKQLKLLPRSPNLDHICTIIYHLLTNKKFSPQKKFFISIPILFKLDSKVCSVFSVIWFLFVYKVRSLNILLLYNSVYYEQTKYVNTNDIIILLNKNFLCWKSINISLITAFEYLNFIFW